MVHSASSELYITVQGNRGNWVLLSSKDFGNTFDLRTTNSPFYVTDHPTDPQILWGSGVKNLYDLSVSYDRGAHWQQLNNLPFQFGKKYQIGDILIAPDSYYLRSILVSPFDPKTVFVSTLVYFPITCSGEYVPLWLMSKNNGRTWYSSEISAGWFFYDTAFPERAYFSNYDGVQLLTASGWHPLTKNTEFYKIISVPGQKDHLYATTYLKELWFSRNGGMNWTKARLGPGAPNSLNARSFPTESFLEGTTAGIYIVDPNRNYHQVINGVREPTSVQNVGTTPHSPKIYLIAGNTFLFRSENSGRTWKNITGNLPVVPNYFTNISVDPKNTDHLFASVDDKLLVSFDSGNSWKHIPQKLNRVYFTPEQSTVYFSKNLSNHLFKSTDGGITFQELPAAYGQLYYSIRDVEIDPFNADIYVGTVNGLYRSEDGGVSAQKIDLLADAPGYLPVSQIVSLSQSGSFLAVTDSGIIKTKNAGLTWEKLSPNQGTIYVADNAGRHLFLINSRLKESIDGGRNWTDITSSIDPGSHIAPILSMTDPRYRPLFIATGLGVYRHD
jgi:hypothetical protein